MILMPKISIKRQTKLDFKPNYYKYYTQATIDLGETNWRTEKDLCYYIYNNFGEGRFMVLAWKKKRKGFWLFWIGEITKDGFMFDKRKLLSTESINELKEELLTEDIESYRNLLEEIINEEIKNNMKKKYGFSEFLKPSGRRGEFIYWEDH